MEIDRAVRKEAKKSNGFADIGTARKILGSDKIIGISANSVEEALRACEQGANYLGIGTIFSTQTYVTISKSRARQFAPQFLTKYESRKKDTKSVLGPEGLRHTLDVLSEKEHGSVPAVCIGGLNASNVTQVMFRGSSPRKPIDGIAVVSAIVAAADPEAASRQLLDLIRKSDRLTRTPSPSTSVTRAAAKDEILKLVPDVIKAVHEQKPLSHNMTNLV